MQNRLLALMGELQAKTNKPVLQSEVASFVGMSPQAFSKWVNNEVRSYSAETLDKLCDFFDCEPGEILYRTQGKESAAN